MKNEDIKREYTKLNNSFTKGKLIFHLGTNAGFFSEYNNMILAMLYCLEHKIRFVLYSRDANFGYQKGWTDYFLPFCEEEEENSFHPKYNVRRKRSIFKMLMQKINPHVFVYHLFNKNTWLTLELWEKFRNRQCEQTHYVIPELGIDGGLQDACRVLINMTWCYNASTARTIQDLIAPLQLPEHYIGFHIRSGDKYKEVKLLDVADYIKNIPPDYPVKNAFVLTDNYLIAEELQNQLQDWQIYTLCGTEERGYFYKDFEQRDAKFIRQSHEKLFASIDILSKSDKFIGTFSSNPGMFLGMRMDKNQSLSVDWNKWRII
ncbi:hypothetical protein AGMMS49982_12230 [Bacteroidia bacterium]|nr:hypothetical protein AGMMS49982_12230 [Bacteroidia bacterium]